MRSRTSHSDVILPTLHVSLPGGQISFMEDPLQNVCAGSGGVKQDTSRFDFLPRFLSATHPFEQFFSNFLNAGIWIKLNTPFATRAWPIRSVIMFVNAPPDPRRSGRAGWRGVCALSLAYRMRKLGITQPQRPHPIGPGVED
jgi:hypothetical protein